MDAEKITIGNLSDELKEANIIIMKVFEKYQLDYRDIELHPVKGTLSLVIMVSNILNGQDTPLKSSLLVEFGRSKKSV